MIEQPIVGTAGLVAHLSHDPGFAAAWELEEPLATLAVNVATLRRARGLTQKELADLAGMRQPRVAEIERGDANPELKTLIRIARALEVGLADLHTVQPAGEEDTRPRAERRLAPSSAARKRRVVRKEQAPR